jgi:hypothetical protein
VVSPPAVYSGDKWLESRPQTEVCWCSLQPLYSNAWIVIKIDRDFFRNSSFTIMNKFHIWDDKMRVHRNVAKHSGAPKNQNVRSHCSIRVLQIHVKGRKGTNWKRVLHFGVGLNIYFSNTFFEISLLSLALVFISRWRKSDSGAVKTHFSFVPLNMNLTYFTPV